MAGAAAIGGGVALEGSGVVTGANAIANGGQNLNDLISMARAEEHHIATDKYWRRDPQWSSRFDQLFRKGDLTLNDALNKVRLPEHYGPHPEAYHQWIYNRLNQAISGLTDQSEIRAALEAELNPIKQDLIQHPDWVNNPPVSPPIQ